MKRINRRDFLAGMGVILGAGRYVQAAKAVPAPSSDNQPLPFVPGSWTLAVLPDTQKYAEKYPGLFNLQTQWIIENKQKHNITYVLTLGDLTNDDNQLQWQRVNQAMSRLDGVVPYTIVLGNHDYSPDGKTRDTMRVQCVGAADLSNQTISFVKRWVCDRRC